MDAQLEAIIHSPKLPFYLEEIQRVLAEEERRRQQFYEEMNEQEKVEFIEGEVICHSPVKKWHNVTSKYILKVVDTYVSIHQLGFVGFEKILIRFTRNDYEPDICFFKKEKSAKFTEDQMFFPAPDFVVEVLSESTEKRDRGVKFEDYALHGVEEYWLVHPEEKYVEQYLLQQGKYELALKSHTGELTSKAIQGFTIPIKAIFEEAANTKAVQGFYK